ncbi:MULTISPECIES: hypothetical protein [unclassified Streptomyces]|uniref:hypothetical protein n=1 Tax=unclassified Streptomyces TaxID=2593676 RepID=UPI001BEA1CE0|nr:MULTISPECIES: hypothetical protein [unclassified Streptomyces]MBT2403993.1 hypothetical protein [Streptomyces sp. ISL-21]MBT2608352.1 hypothetical protein [Streptomyces sp. ISL-87]
MYDEALVPFRDGFERLKRVDLAELAALDEARLLENGLGGVRAEVRPDGAAALGAVGALAGGSPPGPTGPGTSWSTPTPAHT